MEKIDAAVQALSAMAHENRLKLFRLLVRKGPKGMAAGALAKKLDLQPSTLSASLAVLANAGLVSARRDGRSVIYSADYARMTRLLGFLMQDCCNGDAAICTPLAKIAADAACCPGA